MKIHFYKYQGTGNDFILIDNTDFQWTPLSKQIAWLCDRHFGIGADGLMLLNKSSGIDFEMSYYNSDGNLSTMCGNGGRCITAFARRRGLTDFNARFSAADGIHEAFIISEDEISVLVRIKMKETKIEKVFSDGVFIDTGSPHFVVFQSNIRHEDIIPKGRKLRYDPRFQPGGTNVDFVDDSSGKLFVRTYERGVENETLSCGTGVTASAIVYSAIHNTNQIRIQVETPGGELIVGFHKEDDCFSDIWLEGEVRMVFEGFVEL